MNTRFMYMYNYYTIDQCAVQRRHTTSTPVQANNNPLDLVPMMQNQDT